MVTIKHVRGSAVLHVIRMELVILHFFYVLKYVWLGKEKHHKVIMYLTLRGGILYGVGIMDHTYIECLCGLLYHIGDRFACVTFVSIPSCMKMFVVRQAHHRLHRGCLHINMEQY